MVCPGFTATDFERSPRHPVSGEGARIIVEMAKLASDGPTGTFVDISGPVSWWSEAVGPNLAAGVCHICT
jgi:hypothetical protein